MMWKTVELGAICSPKQHKTISEALLVEQGYPVFGANGRIGYYSSYTHERETVAITCRGATCGTVNIAPSYSYITGNAMALDALDEKSINLRFLVYALRHRGFHDVISGSAQPQITRTHLVKIKISHPLLPEQKRIAEILDRTQSLISKRKEAIVKLDILTQSIFIEMFGDPVFNSQKWQRVQLVDVCDSTDDIKCGPFGTQLSKDEYTTEGIPLSTLRTDFQSVKP